MEELLTHFCSVWPYLNDLLLNDVSVSITDKEKFVFYKPGKRLDLKIKPGDPLKAGGAVTRAIEEKKRIVIRADKSLFGVPYIAVAVPLYNKDGQIIGAASIQEAVDRQDDLKQMSATLSENIGVVAATLEEVAAQTQEIAATSRTVSDMALNSYSRIKETDEVISLIRSISAQTNLLGLNAAIESARVGEHGRGFGVVAQEIRKLASGSAESIKKIESVIKTLQTDSGNTAKQIDEIGTIIAQITEAITHVAGAIQKTSSLAQQLDSLADGLSADQ